MEKGPSGSVHRLASCGSGRAPRRELDLPRPPDLGRRDRGRAKFDDRRSKGCLIPPPFLPRKWGRVGGGAAAPRLLPPELPPKGWPSGDRNDARRRPYSRRPDKACADPMARQTRSGVAGISIWLTPNSPSASTIALMTAPSAGVVPPSPAGRMPSGCVGVGTSLSSVEKNGTVSARNSA